MAGIYRLLSAKWNPPKPSTASFEGKTILLTAATGGLGLEAAKKLVKQKTSTLIITGRTEKKAAAIASELSKINPATKIIPLALEMSDISSITNFVTALKQKTPYLDHGILNAGALEVAYLASSSNFENTIQVNTISTILLSLLLLPVLAASPSTKSSDPKRYPHLLYISSGTAWLQNPTTLTQFTSSPKPIHEFASEKNFPPGTMGGSTQYGRSKYLLEFCVRHVAALNYPKQHNIIVMSTCPGMCKSDLGRQFRSSFVLRWGAWLFMALAARETADGANIYITSLEQGYEANGEMWKDDELLHEKAEVVRNMKTKESVKLGDKIWEEMKGILVQLDGEGKTREVLA